MFITLNWHNIILIKEFFVFSSKLDHWHNSGIISNNQIRCLKAIFCCCSCFVIRYYILNAVILLCSINICFNQKQVTKNMSLCVMQCLCEIECDFIVKRFLLPTIFSCPILQLSSTLVVSIFRLSLILMLSILLLSILVWLIHSIFCRIKRKIFNFLMLF